MTRSETCTVILLKTETQPQVTAARLDEARLLADSVALYSDRIDRERRIPPEIADRLIDQGFFRLLLPRSLGGAELDHPSFLKIVRIFAESDASVAWCINQNNVFSTNAVRVDKTTANEIWGDERTVVTNGPPSPGTRAEARKDMGAVVAAGTPEPAAQAEIADGCYSLTGRWNFSSGIRHANWVAALAPVRTPSGKNQPKSRIFLVPKNEVVLIDDWHVGGLRGTGSFGFEAENVLVPNSRSYEPSDPSRESGALYLIDTTPLFASGFATVALGAARAGIDSAIDLTKKKIQQGSTVELSRETTTQRMIGQAEAIWNAARAFLDEAVQEMWDSVTSNHRLEKGTRIRVRLASTHAIRQSAEAVNIAYTICGSSAIFESNPIQRRFQDVHAITQQIQGRPTHYDTVGQYYLGLEPKGIF